MNEIIDPEAERILGATEGAIAVFSAIDVPNETFADLIHPDAKDSLDIAEVSADFNDLAEPGFAPKAKFFEDDTEVIYFNILEGVTESEQLNDTWKAPRALVLALNTETGTWQLREYKKFSWG